MTPSGHGTARTATGVAIAVATALLAVSACSGSGKKSTTSSSGHGNTEAKLSAAAAAEVLTQTVHDMETYYELDSAKAAEWLARVRKVTTGEVLEDASFEAESVLPSQKRFTTSLKVVERGLESYNPGSALVSLWVTLTRGTTDEKTFFRVHVDNVGGNWLLSGLSDSRPAPAADHSWAPSSTQQALQDCTKELLALFTQELDGTGLASSSLQPALAGLGAPARAKASEITDRLVRYIRTTVNHKVIGTVAALGVLDPAVSADTVRLLVGVDLSTLPDPSPPSQPLLLTMTKSGDHWVINDFVLLA